MNTLSSLPGDTATERAVDALLHEHARLQSNDDEEFLASFEAKLALEPSRESIIAPFVAPPRWTTPKLAVTVLATAACICLGMFWTSSSLDNPSPPTFAEASSTETAPRTRAIDTFKTEQEAKRDSERAFDPPQIPPQSPLNPNLGNIITTGKPLNEEAAVGYLGSAPTELSPSTSMTKSGAGTVTLSGSNTYTGGLVVNGGVMSATPAQKTTSDTGGPLIASAGPIGTASVTISGGTIISASGPMPVSPPPPPASAPASSLEALLPKQSEWVDLNQPTVALVTQTVAPPDEVTIGAYPGHGQVRPMDWTPPTDRQSRERYTAAPLNPFRAVSTDPLSTFSVDVDTASYSNIRRLIQSGSDIPPAAVRVEEMINYFPYHYQEPAGEHPIDVSVESAECPWDKNHRLVKIALKAKEIDRSQRKPANLVFLVDVSGSMSGPDRLELVIENLRVLTAALHPDDTVAIVTYAGSEGLALPPTSGADKATILSSLSNLHAGGSTNGGAGITLAYKTAKSRFLKEGINRVILCTDGDFNVGTTSNDALVDLVSAESKNGVFLSVCGYGTGNLNDSMLEAITNKGNGVYYYIDSAREGRKVFQDELFGTLVTVAKDVKLQVEFNPQHAAQYRLIGYDNRMLAKEDFANDKVDAGDIGAGHRVTALYEVIPVNAPDATPIPLKYQQPTPPAAAAEKPAQPTPVNPELLTVKLRYKEPTADVSKPFDIPFVEDPKATTSQDFIFAATVAEFGERLRGHARDGRTLEQLIEAAESARGDDPHGHRAEFIELMRKSAR